MRGPREPVSSRYSDIGHYHITRDPGIPAAPDLASGKLSSSVTQIQRFLSGRWSSIMKMIFLVIRCCNDASWEGTIQWRSGNFYNFWQVDIERQQCLTWKVSLGAGFDFVLDLSAINDDTEAGGSVRHEPGKVVGHSPSPSPPPASPTWSWSQSTLGFSWSMSWRSQLSCPVIKIIQSDQSFHDKSFRCSGALNWHSEKNKKMPVSQTYACFEVCIRIPLISSLIITLLNLFEHPSIFEHFPAIIE